MPWIYIHKVSHIDVLDVSYNNFDNFNINMTNMVMNGTMILFKGKKLLYFYIIRFPLYNEGASDHWTIFACYLISLVLLFHKLTCSSTSGIGTTVFIRDINIIARCNSQRLTLRRLDKFHWIKVSLFKFLRNSKEHFFALQPKIIHHKYVVWLEWHNLSDTVFISLLVPLIRLNDYFTAVVTPQFLCTEKLIKN